MHYNYTILTPTVFCFILYILDKVLFQGKNLITIHAKLIIWLNTLYDYLLLIMLNSKNKTESLTILVVKFKTHP